MKRHQVIILPAAENDIGKAYEWLKEPNEAAAIRWYNRLLEVIFSLDTFPEHCSSAPQSRFLHKEIRQILHGRRQHKYRILFTINATAVHVLHVRHGARLRIGETEDP